MARWCFTVAIGFILLCIQEFSYGEDRFIVTLEVFSGMPDPTWTIESDHPKYGEIKNLLRTATTFSPQQAPSKLGYEGFIVQEEKNGEKLTEKLVVGSETESLQLLLLGSVPDDKISSDIKSIVRREIRSGNVSANVTNPAKRHAPWYRPSKWNGVNVTKNNCYNYASDVKTNTFAQPGRGSGQPFPPVFTADDVKRASEADGCIFTPARKHMCAPSGPRHLAALFVYIGQFGCPWDCDYHWYRLDNNGHWSHKAGQTPATDRDGNGDRIVDPRKAANGWIPYQFVCFMTIDKDTITIR
ncbi:hypothetical protein ACROYT_G030432 [Oculina patagonica]